MVWGKKSANTGSIIYTSTSTRKHEEDRTKHQNDRPKQRKEISKQEKDVQRQMTHQQHENDSTKCKGHIKAREWQSFVWFGQP